MFWLVCSVRRSTGGQRIALDYFGMFQGPRAEAEELDRNLSAFTNNLDAVVLPHAHIDHSDRLPLLAGAGYRGPIFCTAATRDLAISRP